MSATATTFRDLLSKPTDTVERPKALAPGHYIGEIRSHEFGLSRQKQTPFCRFIIVPSEETEDVPQGANDGIELARRELRRDFYITPDALYRLSDMLDAVLGRQAGRSFDERLPETRSVRVMMQVTQRETTDQDGNVTNVYNDIGTIVKA